MKQYIQLKRNQEVTSESLLEILKNRFPIYRVYAKGDGVRIQKNVFTTVVVKPSCTSEEMIISVRTMIPWWVWVFSWTIISFVYMIAKRGFVDEVHATLLKVFRLAHPDLLISCADPVKQARWQSKAKHIGIISTILLIYTYLFGFIMKDVICIFVNEVLCDSYTVIDYNPSNYVINAIDIVSNTLWTLLGVYLITLTKNRNIKLAGVLIVFCNAWYMLNAVFNIYNNLHQWAFSDILPKYYGVFCEFVTLVLFLAAAKLIGGSNKNGALRYVSIGILIFFTALHIGGLIVNYVGFNTDFSIAEERQEFSLIQLCVNVISYSFCYSGLFMMTRGFRKLKKYPVVC